jgi:hypothetical protein
LCCIWQADCGITGEKSMSDVIPFQKQRKLVGRVLSDEEQLECLYAFLDSTRDWTEEQRSIIPIVVGMCNYLVDQGYDQKWLYEEIKRRLRVFQYRREAHEAEADDVSH